MLSPKHRLVLTNEELSAIKEALIKFVTDVCDEPSCASDAQIEAMPAAAGVLLDHFGG